MGASSTRWPGLKPVTYSPTSTISPAMSLPRMCGSFTPGSPLRTHRSRWFRAQALHADQHLVLTRLGIGNIFVAKNFRTTEFVNANGFHCVLPRSTLYLHQRCDILPKQSVAKRAAGSQLRDRFRI